MAKATTPEECLRRAELADKQGFTALAVWYREKAKELENGSLSS